MAKKDKRSEAAKKREKAKGLTVRQNNLVQELSSGQHTTLGAAGIAAGYSDKHPGQSAYQALEGIKLKVPEIMEQVGLSTRVIIEEHLKPKLAAKETKFFHHNGNIVTRQVEALGIQMQAIRTSLELNGAFPKDGTGGDQQLGIKVIVIDVPRPIRGVVVPDVLAPVQGPKTASPVVEDQPRKGKGHPEWPAGYTPPNGHK